MTHEEWLKSHEAAIARHERWLADHEAAVRRHDEEMAEHRREMIELRKLVSEVGQMLGNFIASNDWPHKEREGGINGPDEVV